MLSLLWFALLISATDQARRMCLSSSCAMLLAFLKPEVLTGQNGDDQVLAWVCHLGIADDEGQASGDITFPAAQIKALTSYGIKARFTSQMSFTKLERQIAAGIPSPCGYLHSGPISSPPLWWPLADRC